MKQTAGYVITVLIWIAALVFWGLKGWWIVPAVLFLLHLAELFAVGLKTGRAAGKHVGFTIIMTIIFGVIWWSPLRKNGLP